METKTTIEISREEWMQLVYHVAGGPPSSNAVTARLQMSFKKYQGMLFGAKIIVEDPK